MSAVSYDRLQGLYAQTDDPWQFRTSGYERSKYAATLDALPGHRVAAILELGCGNGELARHLVRRTQTYVGVDGASRAIEAARRSVPDGEFHHLYFPCELPEGTFDLIVLSEFLYFLDRPEIEALAAQLHRRWSVAEIVCVNMRGPTGNTLQGDAATECLIDALAPRWRHRPWPGTDDYRIDLLHPS